MLTDLYWTSFSVFFKQKTTTNDTCGSYQGYEKTLIARIYREDSILSFYVAIGNKNICKLVYICVFSSQVFSFKTLQI